MPQQYFWVQTYPRFILCNSSTSHNHAFLMSIKKESRGTFFEHTLEHTHFYQSLYPSIFNGSSHRKSRVRVPCPPPSTKNRLNACFFCAYRNVLIPNRRFCYVSTSALFIRFRESFTLEYLTLLPCFFIIAFLYINDVDFEIIRVHR